MACPSPVPLLCRACAQPHRAFERAQIVWRRALEFTEPATDDSRPNVPFELFRDAHHDVATLDHARVLGRTRLRAKPDDPQALAAVARLGRAIAFLGVRPVAGDIEVAVRP